jgi:tetratricopeptide (TPR) repeat protein
VPRFSQLAASKAPNLSVAHAAETVNHRHQAMAALVSLFGQGVLLHRAGRLADAERICRDILSVHPDHCDSHHLLGIILHQRGDHASAVRELELALALNPDDVAALNNRGTALTALRRFAEALASYDCALARRPDYADAHHNRGNTLQTLNRFEEAVASYDRAVSLRPAHAEALCNRGAALHALRRFEPALGSYDRALALRASYAEALCNRGNTLHALKRFTEALASCDRALALRPDFAEALCNRGVALQAMERFDDALESYERAIAVRPDYAEALCNRAATLQALERFDEALTSCDRALAAQPHYGEALSNRGAILNALKRFDEALASCDQALAICPDHAEAHRNRGNALYGLNRLDEALASCDQALALRPDYAEAHHNRSVTLYGLKRFDEALASCARAIAIRPDYAEAHFSEACCRLAAGDFVRGWEKYEWRWATRERKSSRRNFGQPLWLGSDDLAGKTILLHAEQGLGDTIQFCRYASRVAERGARVILQVQEPLRALMNTLPGVAQILSMDDALPDFDVHCPLLSLPLALGTKPESIPARTPYLQASPDSVTNWSARLGAKDRPRVGLVWSGSSADHNRSIGLHALSPLLALDLSYVSLQRDFREADAAVVQRHRNLVHCGEELKNFSDTAALMSNLDLIISVDTGAAHLAGALAKPVWILLPFVADWRWLADRDDTPWYPTARLFRQDGTQNWENVLARVVAALRTTFALLD